MGFDLQGIKFILGARRRGVSFAKTATLGRQELFIGPSHLRKLLRDAGLGEGSGTAERMVAESGGYAETLLRSLGAGEIVSIDASSYEGASIVHDMNLPIPATLRDAFSVVIDGGTLEHIFNYPTAIKNCMDMVQPGGHILLMTPANNFLGHGFYQFSPELFFRVFDEVNGYEISRVILSETASDAQWYQIVDPAKAGRRVELINSRPAYLLIEARKLRTVPVLTTPPQQSDYTALWQERHGRLEASGRDRWDLPARLTRAAARRLGRVFQKGSRYALPIKSRRPDAEVFTAVHWLP
jgi:hypothetical protein